MKNFKKVMAAVLTVAMIFSLSLSTFAFDISSGYYTYEIKAEDASGNAITTANPGDEVYLAVYLYETANPTADLAVKANKNASLSYGIIIPDGFSADEAVYEGAEGAEYNTTAGTATITDAEDFMVVINELDITSGLNTSAATAIAKHKFTVATNEESFDFNFYEDMVSFNDGTTGIAKDIVLTPASLKVEKSTPIVNKYTVKFVDGDKEESSVEYEEGATIVAPKDPTPAIGKAFDGWYNGEEKFAEGTTATANVTYTAKYVDVAADAPATGIKSEGYEDAAGYTNVWVGRYTATPAANTVLKTFGVAYGEHKFDKENLVEGEATVEFSVALVGVPTDVTLKGAPFATADWAK